MKKLFGKLKYSVSEDGITATIYAPNKNDGKMGVFGLVHSAAIGYLKTKADFEKNCHVIRLSEK